MDCDTYDLSQQIFFYYCCSIRIDCEKLHKLKKKNNFERKEFKNETTNYLSLQWKSEIQ